MGQQPRATDDEVCARPVSSKHPSSPPLPSVAYNWITVHIHTCARTHTHTHTLSLLFSSLSFFFFFFSFLVLVVCPSWLEAWLVFALPCAWQSCACCPSPSLPRAFIGSFFFRLLFCPRCCCAAHRLQRACSCFAEPLSTQKRRRRRRKTRDAQIKKRIECQQAAKKERQTDQGVCVCRCCSVLILVVFIIVLAFLLLGLLGFILLLLPH